jgi:hypothetical protein
MGADGAGDAGPLCDCQTPLSACGRPGDAGVAPTAGPSLYYVVPALLVDAGFAPQFVG